MASYSDLVDVTFQDATAHQSTDGKDVLGIYMPYHWGPVNKLNIYNRTSFYEAYPESLPIGKSMADAGSNYYDAYAQVKKFFENGGSFVEVYRPQLGNKYSVQSVTVGEESHKVALKYPGAIPAQLLPSETTIVKLTVVEISNIPGISHKISLDAYKNSTTKLGTIESWDGQFVDPAATQDGRYTHFSKVLESSNFLMYIAPEDVAKFGESELEVITNDVLPSTLDTTALTATEATDIEAIFSDIEMSDATLIISPVLTSMFDNAISNIARSTKTMCAVIGLPVGSAFSKAEVTNAFTAHNDKFTVLVAGREIVRVFGQNKLVNCVGGYCGALANIANNVRLNQVASAKTYGLYSGILDKTLSFADVLDLHEKGVTSVYMSKTGPQIFGVHNSLYSTQPNSYFSKTNVMRVATSILKNIFPICFEVIHTDAAANPVSRAIFEARCNSVISDMIAQQNLQADSYANASAEINTDYLTKGGRELNLILVLHFIGLVERIKIKVVATDSSVNAEII